MASASQRSISTIRHAPVTLIAAPPSPRDLHARRRGVSPLAQTLPAMPPATGRMHVSAGMLCLWTDRLATGRADAPGIRDHGGDGAGLAALTQTALPTGRRELTLEVFAANHPGALGRTEAGDRPFRPPLPPLLLRTGGGSGHAAQSLQATPIIRRHGRAASLDRRVG